MARFELKVQRGKEANSFYGFHFPNEIILLITDYKSFLSEYAHARVNHGMII